MHKANNDVHAVNEVQSESQQSEQLQEDVEQKKVSRRKFLQTVSVGSVGVVAGAYLAKATEATPVEAAVPPAAGAAVPPAQDSPWVKDTTPFIEHGGKNLETKLENMKGLITPNDLFFVRNNAPASLEVDIASYVLKVEGDAVENAIELTYEDILNLPSRTLLANIECGGNWRGFFGTVLGQEAEGTQWQTGGISLGEWTGARLGDVLNLAGLTHEAAYVLLAGLDVEAPEEGFRRAMPLHKALDPDTILAYAMNGEPLPIDHGFPLRAVVPGWVGSSNIKWLGNIVVSSEAFWTRNNTTSYILVGEDYPPEGESEGQVATLQTVKSSLALPRPASLSAGPQMIRGFAHSPYKITKVEWSQDGGETWQAATLLDPVMRYAWARFEFEWDPVPGDHVLMTRATDEAGRTQQETIPFNTKGYLGNMILPHEVTVT